MHTVVMAATDRYSRRVRGPRWPWVLVASWCALVFVLSSVPGRDLPEMPAENFDKLVHVAVYAILGALCVHAVRATWRVGAPMAALLAVVLATAYGVSDELHQMLTPGRSADVHDVMADAVGATAGALLVSIAHAVRARRRNAAAAVGVVHDDRR